MEMELRRRCVLETCAARHSRCVSIWARKEKSISKKGFYITELFFVFVMGAVLGNICVKYLSEKALIVCVVMLGMAFVMMFIDGEKQ